MMMMKISSLHPDDDVQHQDLEDDDDQKADCMITESTQIAQCLGGSTARGASLIFTLVLPNYTPRLKTL